MPKTLPLPTVDIKGRLGIRGGRLLYRGEGEGRKGDLCLPSPSPLSLPPVPHQFHIAWRSLGLGGRHTSYQWAQAKVIVAGPISIYLMGIPSRSTRSCGAQHNNGIFRGLGRGSPIRGRLITLTHAGKSISLARPMPPEDIR